MAEVGPARSNRISTLGLVGGVALFLLLWGCWTPRLSSAQRALVVEAVQQELGPEAPPEAVAQAAEREITGRQEGIRNAAAVAALVAVFWMTEALPIPVTSLLPLVLVPLLRIGRFHDVARNYGDPNVLLFLGGFIIAIGMEKWHLHRRIALHIMALVGTSPRRLVLGMMVATAFLSMWISNTATTLMMMTIGLALIAHFEEKQAPGIARLAPCLMLGIAYAASIGGLGTPIGTPPNISLRRIYTICFPGSEEIGFTSWMLLAVPLVCVFLPVAWLSLTHLTLPLRGMASLSGRSVIRRELEALGPITREERWCRAFFLLTAVLWITRRLGTEGPDAIVRGWAASLGLSPYVHDGFVAIAMACLMFAVPTRKEGEPRLLDWDTVVRRVPWGILLLFGGGFALASAIRSSGLSDYIAFQARGLEGASPLSLIAISSGCLTFLTEITSNTATTEVTLPVVAQVATAIRVHPLLLMVPVTLSASCAFMLPVATPPNAIVFGSGRVTMRQMMSSGLILNIIGVILVTLTVYFLAPWALGFNPTGS